MTYDLVVIGGGITGAGIARDAALRGLKVALFEKGDYASGTSSKSSKMIHGGLRYLEHGEIGLVFESVSGAPRADARRAAPRAPAAVLDPDLQGRAARLRAHERRPVDLRLARAVPRAEACTRRFAARRPRSRSSRSCAPRACAARSSTTTAPPTTRASCSRTRSTPQALGADCHTYTEVMRFERRDDGRITGVVVRDRLHGKTWTVGARASSSRPARGPTR